MWAVADALDALAAGGDPGDPFADASDNALRFAAFARGIPVDADDDRNDLIYALLADRLSDDVERGRPYPGQRYTHGWIPVDLITRWNRDLADKQHLVDAVKSGARRAGPYRFSSHDTTQVDLVDFGNGTEGVVTTYGDARDADADQLGAALARSLGIPGPRKLRVADNRTVADLIDGTTWHERETQISNDTRAYELVSELSTRHRPGQESKHFDDYNYAPAAKATEKMQAEDLAVQRREMLASTAATRLGLLDLLMGVDERDVGTILLGPDGAVPVQNETAWRYADKALSPAKIAAGVRQKADGNVPPVQYSDTRSGLPRPRPTEVETWAAFSRIRSWKYNPLTAADVAFLRERLDAVRPEFLRLGRRRWWQFASDRLDAIAKHATGTVDLFAPKG